MNLGKRLKQEREKRGIDGKALAEQVGMSQSRLNALEVRDSKTCEQAPALADALGISLRWLVSGEGDPGDAEWPFPLVSRARWDALPAEGRGYVQASTNRALDECEAATAGVAEAAGRGALTRPSQTPAEPAGVAMAAAWLKATTPERREELLALWNSVRGLVAQGLQVQITAGLPSEASRAADVPAPSAKRGRSR